MWKGKYSEKLVHKKMLQLPDEYTIFNDFLFESNGHSTQIDHIVVSPYGVFVIETISCGPLSTFFMKRPMST